MLSTAQPDQHAVQPLGHQPRRARESSATAPMTYAARLAAVLYQVGARLVLLLARSLDPAFEQLRVGRVNDAACLSVQLGSMNDAACPPAQLGCLFLASLHEP